MASLLYLLPPISAKAADFLVASIWQGLAVAGCVAVLLRLLPGLTAAVRSILWTAVLLLVIFFPGLAMAVDGGQASAAAHAGLVHASDAWSLALLGVWVALSLLRMGQLVGSAVRLRRIAGRAVVVAAGEPVAALLRGSRRRVELCVSEEIDRPSVAGFFRSRILLSPELLARLSERELEQVVLHEIEHLRRYDDWTNLVQKLSLALVPLHPVLLWLDRQMCRERERACDDSVLRQTRARKAYASCLTRLAEDSVVRRGVSLGLSVLGGALGTRERTSELGARVHRILHAPVKPMGARKICLTTVALLVTAFAGAAGLARSPELISFASAPRSGDVPQALALASAHMDAATPRLEAARFQPAGFATTTSFQRFATHATMVKAVMPETKPAGARPTVMVPVVARIPAVARRTERHARLSRTALRQPNVVRPYRYFAVAAWQPVTIAARVTSTPATPTLSTTASAAASTTAQAPQFLYAAVPFSDGWLIIQL